jgi:hypothetical protein
MSEPAPLRRPRRVLASALLLALMAVTAGAVAPAAVAAPRAAAAYGRAPAPGQITWSASPANAKGPDSRAKFVYYNIAPGSVIRDRIAVINRGGASAAYTIYATDATGTTAQNVLTFLKVGGTPKDIGSWEKFQLSNHMSAQLSLVVGGHQGILVPFTISVPSFATPGDHTGAVMVQLGVPHRTKNGTLVIVYNRIAVPIELRVSGPLHSGLQVQSVSTSFNDSVNPFGAGSAAVSYTVANTGNVRISGDALVNVTGPFGMKSVVKALKLPVVLPGDSIRLTAVAGGLYPAGPMAAHVTVTPAWPPTEVPAGQPLTKTHEDASLFAVPWSLLGLIVLLAALGCGAWYLLRWRRQQRVDEVAEVIERTRRETEQRLAASGQAASPGGETTGASAGSGPDAGSTAE